MISGSQVTPCSLCPASQQELKNNRAGWSRDRLGSGAELELNEPDSFRNNKQTEMQARKQDSGQRDTTMSQGHSRRVYSMSLYKHNKKTMVALRDHCSLRKHMQRCKVVCRSCFSRSVKLFSVDSSGFMSVTSHTVFLSVRRSAPTSCEFCSHLIRLTCTCVEPEPSTLAAPS